MSGKWTGRLPIPDATLLAHSSVREASVWREVSKSPHEPVGHAYLDLGLNCRKFYLFYSRADAVPASSKVNSIPTFIYLDSLLSAQVSVDDPPAYLPSSNTLEPSSCHPTNLTNHQMTIMWSPSTWTILLPRNAKSSELAISVVAKRCLFGVGTVLLSNAWIASELTLQRELAGSMRWCADGSERMLQLHCGGDSMHLHQRGQEAWSA
jgi:hypothetical protein